MNVNELVRDATALLNDAGGLADTLPHEHQAVIRALIASMVVLVKALAESHRDLASRVGSSESQISLHRPRLVPLAVGME
jgi:hypothetical protein